MRGWKWIIYAAVMLVLTVSGVVRSKSIVSSGDESESDENRLMLLNAKQETGLANQAKSRDRMRLEILRRLLELNADEPSVWSDEPVDSDESEIVVKKSAPKRIFIGKRLPGFIGGQ